MLEKSQVATLVLEEVHGHHGSPGFGDDMLGGSHSLHTPISAIHVDFLIEP
jgi:hypothetical protein